MNLRPATSEFAFGESPVRLLHGDAAKQLRSLDDESVDLIVTSPPYADQRKNTYGGVAPDRYVEWFMPIADELQRVLKPGGTFIFNINIKPRNAMKRFAPNTRKSPIASRTN